MRSVPGLAAWVEGKERGGLVVGGWVGCLGNVSAGGSAARGWEGERKGEVCGRGGVGRETYCVVGHSLDGVEHLDEDGWARHCDFLGGMLETLMC